ncbi:AraC family transcriptional regulator [Paraburkholderia sp. Tr-20389]|uniref:AraC family transcriptional regulator n=1 Tax=Paraburkholderia sp. Tr-20389 TaxID=2703903 RepID=UPI00197EA8CC|nr:AraC family transcriptional regulator [Paraburkholderia sp. Tr-20389]MBN3751650.1 AraC family transcriptional regulator [Paraburkholderia sp. Tr-20389]
MSRTDPPSDWIQHATSVAGVERIEACFHGNAYEMHRHDTYAIGRTLAGVHCFHYRNARRDSLPGNTIVIHPDELHDGHAGTDEGFRYRMVYIEPSLIQDILGGYSLPFLEGGVTTDPRLAAASESLLQLVDHTLEPLEQSDGLAELADALALSVAAPVRLDGGDYTAARRALEYLRENSIRIVAVDELEAITGRDRWSLSRDFRLYYGTSPHRYQIMRRLDMVRRFLRAELPLAHAAVAAGFVDQSHMTHHFRRTFGLTPGRWRQIARGSASR